uniref:tRNA-splicing endonuclease n=1 Tax=Archaeoglobus fulgidus TaxID=2234 RepID=A0A7J2TIR1_ARCFL
MIGKIQEDFAVLNSNRDLERNGFGQKRGEKIYLHPVEALYLQLKGRAKFAELKDLIDWVQKKVDSFPAIYFVYEDLRNRGNRVKIGGKLLFTNKAFLPISENEVISFEKIRSLLSEFGELILSVVDEECEVTYYSIKEPEMRGEQIEELPKVKGVFLKDRILTENLEIFEKYFYGSRVGKYVALSILEGFYLFERGVLEVENSEEMMRIAKEDEFQRRFFVYRDLKQRNFVVKTGFKFGSDFRVYRKVESADELPHSEFLVSVVEDEITVRDLSRSVRLANSVRKKLVFAWNGKYFLFEWVKV